MPRDPNQRTSLLDTPPAERADLAQRAADFVIPPTTPSASPVTPQLVLFEALEAALRGEVKRLVVIHTDETNTPFVAWSNMSPGELGLFQRKLGLIVDDLAEDDELWPGEEEDDE